jgi:hypothetical protein
VIPASTTGAGATNAQVCSSPEIPQRDGAQRAEVMSTSQVPITVYRTLAKRNPIGVGATSVRACSTVQIQAPDIALPAEVMTSQEAIIIIFCGSPELYATREAAS